MRAAVLVLAAGLSAGPVLASDTAVNLRYGDQGSFRLLGASARFGPIWTTDVGRWALMLQPEAELGQFRYTGSRSGPSKAEFLGGGLMLRMVRGEGGIRPYGEVGLGAALFSRTSIGSKDLSTAFQFSESIGLGVQFAESWSLGWRYSHYSNANIKKPNDGIDMHQILFGVRF